ncbi:alpha/beta hydrolase [Microbacterium sp. NPDC058345]|uniref:alpha/beta hydrolase n=1 Tax=Microbacterium sp. NPDC058345 TaxID=3346455 RepID=UPI00365E61E6
MRGADASGQLVVFLHGRGGTSRDLAWVQHAIPAPWRPVSLQAPLPLGSGFEWFRVPEDASLGPLSRNVAPAAELVVDRVEAHAPTAGVGLVGYSQGAAVALHALRRHPQRFAFAALFAGFTTIDDEPTDVDLALRRPPLLWARGSVDDVIPQSDIDRLHEFLPAHSALDERVYAGVGHEISADMASDLYTFIGSL